MEDYNSIRKPMPPPDKIINPKDENKKNRFDWHRELEELDEEEDYKGINNDEHARPSKSDMG